MNLHTPRKSLIRRFSAVIGRTITGITLATLVCARVSAADSRENASLAQARTALDAWRMDELNALLGSLPTNAEGDYIRGIAFNRTNDIDSSTRALRRALSGLAAADSEKAINALLTLTDNYQKTSSYVEESNILNAAMARYADKMKPDDLASVKTGLAFATALGGSPAQTVSIAGEARLPIRRNAVGTLDVNAVANGVSAAWMLDSGANCSIVTESFAKRLKLDIAGKIPAIGSAPGITIDGQVAIVKEIRLGSAILHNVVVLVVGDEQMRVKLPTGAYQIDAALGYPVFQALGRVSFTGETSILIGAKSIPVTEGTQLYMDGLTPVVLLDVEGTPMPFILDTGVTSTSLSSTYWKKIGARASEWPRIQRKSSGLGGAKTFDQVVQPE